VFYSILQVLQLSIQGKLVPDIIY